jgi:hypothetical protein
MANRRAETPTPADPGKTGFAHQPCDTLAADLLARGNQLSVDSWRSVRSLRTPMNLADGHEQRLVGLHTF